MGSTSPMRRRSNPAWWRPHPVRAHCLNCGRLVSSRTKPRKRESANFRSLSAALAVPDRLLRRGRGYLGIAGHTGAIVEPRNLLRLPDRKSGPLAGIIIERPDPQDDVRLDGTLGDQMRSTHRAEIAKLARRRLPEAVRIAIRPIPGDPSVCHRTEGRRFRARRTSGRPCRAKAIQVSTMRAAISRAELIHRQAALGGLRGPTHNVNQ